MSNSSGEWYGVDFDGTLAYSDRWRGRRHLGKPIPAMVKRVQQMLAQGKTVKLFTARADGATEEDITNLQLWMEEYIGHVLEITCKKDKFCVGIYDDKARQVVKNTGKVVSAINKMKEL